MGYRTGRNLHIALMIWVTLLFLGAWLPFVRGLMDGPSYRWGGGMFGMHVRGAGLSGDFWYPLLKSAIGLAFLSYGWRSPNGRVRIALIVYLAIVLADTLFDVITNPEGFRVREAALNLDTSLIYVAPALDALFLALAMVWALRAPPLAARPLALANKLLLGLVAALIPVQFYLLSAGRGQDANDTLGVFLAMIGWLLLSAGLAPWRGRREGATPAAATETLE